MCYGLTVREAACQWGCGLIVWTSRQYLICNALTICIFFAYVQTFCYCETYSVFSVEFQVRVLFVCSRNKLRSPTAEEVFTGYKSLEVASAGLNHDSAVPITRELVQWAETIFVMESAYLSRLRSRFQKELKDTKVVCLKIPDRFAYMDPELVSILETKVGRQLRLN